MRWGVCSLNPLHSLVPDSQQCVFHFAAALLKGRRDSLSGRRLFPAISVQRLVAKRIFFFPAKRNWPHEVRLASAKGRDWLSNSFLPHAALRLIFLSSSRKRASLPRTFLRASLLEMFLPSLASTDESRRIASLHDLCRQCVESLICSSRRTEDR